MEEQNNRQGASLLNIGDFTARMPELLARLRKSSVPLHVVRIHVERKYRSGIPEQSAERVHTVISTTLQSIMRKNDLIFRWGDHNYVIVLPALSTEASLAVAQKLRDGIASALESYILTFQIRVNTKSFNMPPVTVDDLKDEIDTMIDTTM